MHTIKNTPLTRYSTLRLRARARGAPLDALVAQAAVLRLREDPAVAGAEEARAPPQRLRVERPDAAAVIYQRPYINAHISNAIIDGAR